MGARHGVLAVVAVIAAILLLLAGRSATAADAARGRALYELRCGGCHGESVHGRAQRAARDFAAVRAWVERWKASLSLDWSDDDVDDVTVHLNGTYYHFACPPSTCKVVSLMQIKRHW